VEWIAPARHRLGWLARRAFRGGFTHTRMWLRRDRAGALGRGLPRALAGLAAAAAALPLRACAGRAPAARAWLRLCVQAGHLWAYAGRPFEEYREAGDVPGT